MALEILARKGAGSSVLMVSDSQYLVKGMREWVPGWKARGWTRKGGPIENLELWKALDATSRKHEVQWAWLRGHQRAPEERVCRLAGGPRRAGAAQHRGRGATPSSPSGSRCEQEKGHYAGYDPDAGFAELEKRVAAGEEFPLVLVE